MSAILAVDVGSVRLGLAICEHPDLPAVPLVTIAHASREADVASVIAVARERGATTIIVGNPLRMDGTIGPAAEKINRFADALGAAFDGQVTLVDERLTSAAAAKRLQSSELSGSKRRKIVDQMAAVEILESYRARLRRGD